MSSQPARATIPSSPLGQRSLFWKVLALVLVTAVIATCAIGLYFQYALRDTYTHFLHEQVGSYIRMVVRDVGVPPDTAAARAISLSYPLDIRIEREGFTWSTGGVAPSDSIADGANRERFADGDSIVFRRYDDHFFALVKSSGWLYIVRLRSTPEELTLLPAALLFGVLALLFVAAYYFVQRFLRPVSELMVGVEAVGSGDFEYQVPICSSDELGELTRAFNAMSQQVAAILASRRRLLFDVSHELRSPLTRMNVALAMLPEGKAKVSIERNIRELNVMITELLENERLAVLGGMLVVEEVDVVALARTVIETFGHDNRRIEFDTLTESLPITADSQRLTVALRNVISNALKYSSENEGVVKVTVFPDDNGARFVVADQGIGIPPEAQEKVFETFYRTDDSRSRATGGYGLGLSLTKSIVEAHGGTIKLNSTMGCGTTVMMWFPNAPEPGAVARPRVAMPQPRGEEKTA